MSSTHPATPSRPAAASGVGPTHVRQGVQLALVSMLSVQIGIALSVGLMDRLGVEAVAWLRLSWAGLLMLLLGRPWRLRLSRSGWLAGAALGLVIAATTLLFLAAAARLPLGTASALEFLGPLAVSVARGRGPHRLTWPVLAGAGVLLLTEPWAGTADPVGVAFALASAGCWAAYIVLTQRVGQEAGGISGLAVSMPVAAVAATVVVGPEAAAGLALEPRHLLVGLGLAVLLPLVPYALEMLALQRLPAAAFGTLMSLEPALALLVGLVLLAQVPGLPAVLGIGLVVAAGIGATSTATTTGTTTGTATGTDTGTVGDGRRARRRVRRRRGVRRRAMRRTVPGRRPTLRRPRSAGGRDEDRRAGHRRGRSDTGRPAGRPRPRRRDRHPRPGDDARPHRP
jgi:inner membrane transporter RhtA